MAADSTYIREETCVSPSDVRVCSGVMTLCPGTAPVTPKQQRSIELFINHRPPCPIIEFNHTFFYTVEPRSQPATSYQVPTRRRCVLLARAPPLPLTKTRHQSRNSTTAEPNPALTCRVCRAVQGALMSSLTSSGLHVDDEDVHCDCEKTSN